MRHVVINNEDGLLEVEMLGDMPFIHLKLHKWSKEKYVEYLAIFKTMKDEMKKKGVGAVYTNIPKDDEKLFKFQTMFGFFPFAETPSTIVMFQEV